MGRGDFVATITNDSGHNLYIERSGADVELFGPDEWDKCMVAEEGHLFVRGSCPAVFRDGEWAHCQSVMMDEDE